jgi:hypothetical protein
MTNFDSNIMNGRIWIFLLTSLIMLTGCNKGNAAPQQEAIQLLRPADGIALADNSPVLSWQHVDGDGYVIWIDGIRMDTVPPSRNWYIPFPMSYGKHQWFVEAIRGKSLARSRSASFVISDKPLSGLPENALLLRENWKVASSVMVGDDGALISGEGEVAGAWKTSSVPATVLSVLVRNGLYPNPYIGLNNMKIPDCSDAFNQEHDLLQYSHIPGENPWKAPYWFSREFVLPDHYEGRQVWLTLGEINYRAEVWLNGVLLADTSRVIGMERQFRFNVTDRVDFAGKNRLAIAIHPPDHPGKPAPPPLTPLADPGTNMADGMISRDYTKWDVLGWDWIPAVRDRDMGITEDVYVHASDEIELDNLYITTDLPLPDTSSASVTISADLINLSEGVKKGTIKGTITKDGHAIDFEQPFVVEPGDTVSYIWDQRAMPQLLLKNPRLWWPNGYGSPELYQFKLTAQTETGDQASKKLNFGIREVGTYLGSMERVYQINGKDIYCKGGNWVLDMTLNWTASRYEQEIRMTRNAHLNMLRIWGPTGAPPEVFYEAADRHGILLWQDFLNDYWGTFRNTPGYRPKESLFEKATISITRRYRNHPSLVIWSSGNEGPNPREELIVNKILPAHDGRDSKHYLRISNGDGLHGGGPYHTIEPEAYFSDPKLNGFSSEIGPSGVPVAESVLKFMPDLGNSWMPGRFPLDGVWAYHDANDWPGRDSRKFSSYDNIIRSYYGSTDSASVEDAVAYLEKCQLLNYDVYRASIDAISAQLWGNASGILLWKSNSAWPSMTWQIYDWYLQAHAGYYGVRKAAAPVTIFFDRKTKQVQVLNATHRIFPGVTLEAKLYDREMKELWNTGETTDLKENVVVTWKDTVPVADALCFLKLKVTARDGTILADNFYWLHAGNDFTSMQSLNRPDLAIASLTSLEGKVTGYSFVITNRGEGVALMTHLRLTDPVTGLEVLPTYWSDNFISLLPGEEKRIVFSTGNQHLPENLHLSYKSYNMESAGSIPLGNH